MQVKKEKIDHGMAHANRMQAESEAASLKQELESRDKQIEKIAAEHAEEKTRFLAFRTNNKS